MTGMRQIVARAVLALLALWMAYHYQDLTASDGGIIQLVLGVVFFLSVMLRIKPVDSAVEVRPKRLMVLGVCGMLAVILGLITPVRNLEWLGLLVLAFASLRLALPVRYGYDLKLAFFLLYWVHPLPAQVFNSLQLVMQELSVVGAEWLLHTFNVRAWADHFILHTPMRTFLVPEACSGMRTAITVLYGTLGVCVMMRFRVFETFLFLVLGLVQTLLLNIVRITLMVVLSGRMPVAWGDTFLHDSLGVFLLVSILLVQLEASAWQMRKVRILDRKAGMQTGVRDTPDAATTLPRFWYHAARWFRPVALGVVVILAVVFLAYKHRPYHRAMMLRDVLAGLAERDTAAASRGVEQGIRWLPDHREFRVLRIQILLMTGRHAEALQHLNTLPTPLDMNETVLKSRALLMLGQLDDAIALIRTLPPYVQQQPVVAMLLAEYGALRNDPEMVKAHVVRAAALHLNVERVRALYPFLQGHEQWQTVAATDQVRIPYRRAAPAAVMIRAHLRSGNLARASRLLGEAMEQWPDDPQFLGSLFNLALQDPGGPWEERFAGVFKAVIERMGIDTQALLLQQAFTLLRPDLGWLAWAHLESRDPDDPTLMLTVARFADAWFTFRRRNLGLSASDRNTTIDLRPLVRQMEGLPPFRSLFEQVPFKTELAAPDWERFRDRCMARCLEEFGRRQADGTLGDRLKRQYPAVLAMAGRYEDAHAAIDRLKDDYPEDADEWVLRHAMLFEQQGRWQDCYEQLQQHQSMTRLPNLASDIMMVNSLMNMNLGITAMVVAREARGRFTDATRLHELMAAIWSRYGFHEQALFYLERSGGDISPRLLPQVLFDSQRYAEAEKMARSLGVEIERPAGSVLQPLAPPPAELVITRRWPSPLSAAERAAEADEVEARVRQAGSPFFRDLSRLEAEWLRMDGAADVSDPARWLAIGRNDLERGAALNRLTILMARQGRFGQALPVAEAVCRLMPGSAVAWWVWIGLSEGDRAVVQAARAACPDDSEIWLADLVSRYRTEGKGPWTGAMIREAISGETYALGTLVRAGHFLVREDAMDEAVLVARHVADTRAQGYLPALVLGLQCALKTRDAKWALSAAFRCVDAAKDPGMFYRTIVEIKSAGQVMDADLFSALEYLQGRYPQEPQWIERLGFLYLLKGDSQRAETVLEPLLTSRGDITVRTLNMSAESARSQGNHAKAIRILRTARTLYPEDATILNNLIYNMAQQNETAAGALALLPELLKTAPESFEVLDTAALVYLQNGRLDEALDYSRRALAVIQPGSRGYALADVWFTAARIAQRLGQRDEASSYLKRLRDLPHRSSSVDRAARELERQIQRIDQP